MGKDGKCSVCGEWMARVIFWIPDDDTGQRQPVCPDHFATWWLGQNATPGAITHPSRMDHDE